LWLQGWPEKRHCEEPKAKVTTSLRGAGGDEAIYT
jgi:hypothetical protein